MKVSIIGLGYVGFPLACVIAKNEKYDVYGYDLSKEKIKLIENKISPVEDKQAQIDIKTVNLSVSTNDSILENSDIFIIAVPTPVYKNKNPDLNPIKSSCLTILKYLKKGNIVILESTVNPGICNEFILPILEQNGLKGGIDFDLAHCPERINPGDEKWNVHNIPRNVGSTSIEGTKKVAEFYRSFITGKVNEMSSLMAAEATKIVENTFRDVNIAYVNELAKSFDLMDLDIVEVINGAANKPFAFMAHYPGCGVGGHCIPVDPYYLIEKAKNIGFDHKFLRNARYVNESMPKYTFERLIIGLNELEKSVKGTKVGLLGLSYKANIGDFRESPALLIKTRLEKMGADLMICEPHSENVENNYNIKRILNECEAIVLATNHKEFLEITDWGKVKLIIDGRNCLNKDDIKKQGILYFGIGRK